MNINAFQLHRLYFLVLLSPFTLSKKWLGKNAGNEEYL